MLPRPLRLNAASLFRRALAGRRLGSNDCCTVLGLPRLPHHRAYPYPRIGFVVSKKIHKHAVRRNRIKRRLREIARRTLLTPGFAATVGPLAAIVIIARPGALTAPYAELRDAVLRCLAPRGSRAGGPA